MDSEDMLRTIARNLEYNRDARGRHLVRDVDLPQLRLRKGWRLEPSRSLPDVAQFEFQAVPFEATFWVAPRTARLTHSCPLYLLEGVSHKSWSIDLMHAWHLGPLQQLVSLAIHTCISSGVFSPRTANMAPADVRELALLAIKAELFQFYKILRSEDPDWRQKGSEACWLVGCTQALNLVAFNQITKKTNPVRTLNSTLNSRQ